MYIYIYVHKTRSELKYPHLDGLWPCTSRWSCHPTIAAEVAHGDVLLARANMNCGEISSSWPTFDILN